MFDTNYLRGIGVHEYLSGEIPETLRRQLTAAVARGDLVALPSTVRLELNACLSKVSKDSEKKYTDAINLLQQAGHEVIPAEVSVAQEVDVFEILQAEFPDVYIFEPSLEDYKEAERRTSYRLPPLPKNPEGEEYRDRLMWCQLVNRRDPAAAPVVLISNDTIFKNGAESSEGVSAHIRVIDGVADLDQWLDQRPAHIQLVIDQLLMFGEQLCKAGINIQEDDISLIEGLRNIYEPSGSLIRKFVLHFKNMPATMQVSMISLGETPLSLSIIKDGDTFEINRDMDATEHEKLTHEQFFKTLAVEQEQNELRSLIRDHR